MGESSDGDYDLSHLLVPKRKRSAGKLEERKQRRQQKSVDKAHAKDEAIMGEASKRIPSMYAEKEVNRVHTDGSAQGKWGGRFAYPRGLKSFVDDFKPASLLHDVGVGTTR